MNKLFPLQLFECDFRIAISQPRTWTSFFIQPLDGYRIEINSIETVKECVQGTGENIEKNAENFICSWDYLE